MAKFTNCLELISRIDERDQAALVARLDELIEGGMAPSEAQTQAAVDVLASVEREGGLEAEPANLSSFEVDQLPELLRKSGWAILTAENPNGNQAPEQDNAAANARLIAELRQRGLKFLPVVGRYGGTDENSFAIVGIPPQEAADLGRRYGQEAVLTRDGFVYQDGSINPAKGIEVFKEPPEDFFSRVTTGAGDAYFRVDIDFDTRVGPEALRSADRLPGLEIVEVADGFDAMLNGKRVGRLRDNLPRGAAQALDEDASVDIVKVDDEVRGKGVGRALYEAFSERHGGRIIPSGKTSKEAWRLWKAMFPEKVDKFVRQEAERIRSGASPQLVVGNITDPEVASRVSGSVGGAAILSTGRSEADIQSARADGWIMIDNDLPSKEAAERIIRLRKHGNSVVRPMPNWVNADFRVMPSDISGLWSIELRTARGLGDADDQSGATRSTDRPRFYSQLSRAIEQAPDRVASQSAAQWKLWLDANAPKLGVKKDEIEWSGIKDYLDLQGKAKVTRDQLVAYLADSGVRVQEVVLGDKPEEPDWRNVQPSDLPDGFVSGRDASFRHSDGYTSKVGVFESESGMWWAYQDGQELAEDTSEQRAVEAAVEAIKKDTERDPDSGSVRYEGYVVPGGPLSRDTEILTRDGWVRMDEVQIGDEVMTRRDEDGALEWQPVEAVPTVFAEKLYHFKNQSINMRVSPCHKMVVKRRRRSTGEILRVTAEQLWSMSEMVAPLTGSWSGGEFSTLFEQDAGDVAELLGWYIAEGHTKTEPNGKKSSIGIAQCREANADKCARIEALLDRMGIGWNYSGGQYWLRTKKMSRDLVQLLWAQGKAAEKYVPGFMFNAPSSAISRLLDGLLLGDGCRASQSGRKPRWAYHTISRQLADDVQVLALLTGKRGTITRRKNGLYVVNINDKQWASVDDAKHGVVDYNDTAYCVTVKNHSIYVRTGGVAAFTGNSNYREVLITLPGKTNTRKQWALLDQNGETVSVRPDPPNQRWLDQVASRGYSIEERTVADKQANDRDGQYTSSHWPQPNILAHLRVDDRTDADGKRVLFINEIQSDWGQEGKKNGFKNAGLPPGHEVRKISVRNPLAGLGGNVDQAAERYAVFDSDGNKLTTDFQTEGGALSAFLAGSSKVPGAPFVTDTNTSSL